MFRELQAVVMPGGAVQLEWTETAEQIDKSRQLLEQEIEKRFTADTGAAFLFLGFSDTSLPLSPSLEFLLSEEVIRGRGEEWITEMSNEELIGLFRLGV